MKHFSILQGRCYVVELPDKANNPAIFNDIGRPYLSCFIGVETFRIYLPDGEWQIIGLLAEVTEEQVATLQDSHTIFPTQYVKDMIEAYPNHLKYNQFFKTALESLESAMLAEGWLFQNPFGENEPVVDDPDPHSQYHGAQQDDVSRWQSAQSRVLSRKLCLILKKL